MRARKAMSDGESGGLVAIRPLSQLTSATVSRNSQSYGFDPFGNLTTYGTNTLTIDPAGPNRLNKNAHDYIYENAGNMLGWGWLAFGWDGFNQLQTVQGTGIARYNGFTAEGERVLMRDQNTTTITLRGLDNKVLRDITYDPTAAAGQQWRWAKDYVYRDGSLLASVSATDGIRHYALDHLGTPRLVTDHCGDKVKLFTYLPFGQEVPQPAVEDATERMRFTVHERDLGKLDAAPGDDPRKDDLDYMHARTYGPSLGRFLAVDVGKWDLHGPQTWNRYAYVLGNPMRHLDLSGLETVYFTMAFVVGAKVELPLEAWNRTRELIDSEVQGGGTHVRYFEGSSAIPANFRFGLADPDGMTVYAGHAYQGGEVGLPFTASKTNDLLENVPRSNSIVMIAACNSDQLAGRFGISKETTGRAFVGFHGWVNSINLTAIGAQLADYLKKGLTVGQAVALLRREYKGSAFRIVLIGDTDAHFTKQMEKMPVTHQ